MVAQDEQPKSGTILSTMNIHSTCHISGCCEMLYVALESGPKCLHDTHWEIDRLTLLQTSFMYTLTSRNLFEVGVASFDFT